MNISICQGDFLKLHFSKKIMKNLILTITYHDNFFLKILLIKCGKVMFINIVLLGLGFSYRVQYVENLYIWIGMSFRVFLEPFVVTSENAFDQLTTLFSLVRDNSLSTRLLPFIKKITLMEITSFVRKLLLSEILRNIYRDKSDL